MALSILVLFPSAASIDSLKLHGLAAFSFQKYAAVAERYSQTASKAEQIALCQFIRDGHLTSQTKNLKKASMLRS